MSQATDLPPGGQLTSQRGDNIQNERPLPKLPMEIQLKILKEACLLPSWCLELLFEETHDKWSCDVCREMTGAGMMETTPAVTLDVGLMTVCRIYHEEVYKNFYEHHIFVFSKEPTRVPGDRTEPPTHIRDPRALRLLRFIDMPAEVGSAPTPNLETHTSSAPIPDARTSTNSENSAKPFKPLHSPEEFRASVQHLVLCVHPYMASDESQLDWSWPIMVDWTTLPKLKTLYLDFRAIYHRKKFPGQPTILGSYLELMHGGKRMECLSLEKLVIVGACSNGNNVPHYRRDIELIFSGALSKTGKLEFKDWDRFIEW